MSIDEGNDKTLTYGQDFKETDANNNRGIIMGYRVRTADMCAQIGMTNRL
jgi:hypothetical protein